MIYKKESVKNIPKILKNMICSFDVLEIYLIEYIKRKSERSRLMKIVRQHLDY